MGSPKTTIVYAAAALQELWSLKTKKYYEKVRYTAEKLKSTNCTSKWEYDSLVFFIVCTFPALSMSVIL